MLRRRAFPILLLGLMALPGATVAVEEAQVRAMVEKLGDPVYRTREEASLQLMDWAVEDPQRVLTLLPLRDPDPEIQARLDDLRQRLPWEGLRRHHPDLADPILAQAAHRLSETPSYATALQFLATAGMTKKAEAAAVIPAILRGKDPEALKRVIRALSHAAGGSLNQLASTAFLADPEAGLDGETVSRIAAIGRDPIVRALSGFLKDGDGSVRLAALGELRMLGEKSAAKDAVELLQDKDAQVREGAAFAVTELADPSTALAVAAFLKHPDPTVRAGAVAVLGRLRGKSLAPDSVVPEMTGLLDDRDPKVRHAAFLALHAFRGALGPAMVKRLGNPNDPYAAGLLGACPDASALPALLELIEKGNLAAQCHAFGVLCNNKDRAAIPAMMALLDGRDSVKRWGAARVLGWMGEKSVVPHALGFLGDPDPRLRRGGAEALGRLGDKAHVSAIVTLLEDPDPEVRYQTCVALRELSGQKWAWSSRKGMEATARAWWREHRDDPQYAPKRP